MAESLLWSATVIAGDTEVVIDCQIAESAANAEPAALAIHLKQPGGTDVRIPLPQLKPETYHRISLAIRDRQATLNAGGQESKHDLGPLRTSSRLTLGLAVFAGRAQFMNLYHRPLK